jgi:hypothetical protein
VTPHASERSDVLAFAATVTEAFRAAVADALRRHKLAGNAVAVWREGKVVLLQPEEIPDHQTEAAAAQPRFAADGS